MKNEQSNQSPDKFEQTTLKVEFATDLLIVTFLIDDCFQGRRLAIKGEALDWGFEAYPSTMRWGEPYESEIIDSKTQAEVVHKILHWKSPTGFKIFMNDESKR